jgi:hypothetical protein
MTGAGNASGSAAADADRKTTPPAMPEALLFYRRPDCTAVKDNRKGDGGKSGEPERNSAAQNASGVPRRHSGHESVGSRSRN